jgi:energy-coupling factor transport system ATP-binding protein
MNIIEVKDLSFSYDTDEVLKNVSFKIEEGKYVSIIGPNGSGKSTLAKLLIGLLEKKQGSIFIDGLELNEQNVAAIRDKIGIVFQNPDNQFIGASVRDDIAFGLENHCVAHEKMDPLIETFADKVKMSNYLESEPSKLSGGQKQRVAIAGVLAMMPKIIIFDEATSMLDPEGKKEIRNLINQLHEEKKMTILSISHDIDEVANSDEVLVMDGGQIVMQGKPEKVLSQRQELIRRKLDVPFTLKIVDGLNAKGIKIEPTLSIEELAEGIWQSFSIK